MTVFHIQQGEKDSYWACSMLFEGASCQLPDDWKLEQRRLQQEVAARQQQQALQSKQQARDAMLAGRARRAEQRHLGLPAESVLPQAQVAAVLDDVQDEDEPFSPSKRKAGSRKRKAGSANQEAECEDRDHWEECSACQHWVNLGKGREGLQGLCEQCGGEVRWRGHQQVQSWVQCDACGRWRTVADTVLRDIEAQEDKGKWTCAQMQRGATCRSSQGDWGAALRKKATQLRHQNSTASQPPQLSTRQIDVGSAQPEKLHWQSHEVRASSHLLEYIPGRDQLWGPEMLAAGLDVYDAGCGEHVLWACALPTFALSAATPFICRGLQLFQEGKLPVCTDGRLSAGPLDLPAFLAQAGVGEAVRQALHKCKAAQPAHQATHLPGLPSAEPPGKTAELVAVPCQEGDVVPVQSQVARSGMHVQAHAAQKLMPGNLLCEGQNAVHQTAGSLVMPEIALCNSEEQQPTFRLKLKRSAAVLEVSVVNGLGVYASTSAAAQASPTTLSELSGANMASLTPVATFQGPLQPFSGPQTDGSMPKTSPDESAAQHHTETQHSASMQVADASKSQAAVRPQLWQVLHVSPDMRKAYIGEATDQTANGKSIMAFNKSWRSLPIQSWSGGRKLADMPGSQPNKLVSSKLSLIMHAEEDSLVRAAEAVWNTFAAGAATAAAAQRMMHNICEAPSGLDSRLGATAWNAYSFNIDYRTGSHLDGKNTPGSYSALIVFETGEPFCGSYYMLPQYHMGLDVRQGCVVFHRSGDAGVGAHGNSGLWRNSDSSHRVAVVLYQTDLKASSRADSFPATSMPETHQIL
ncbi:TPA: hypothetical protein ACH3X1_010392 [Trebouxia sp. C0004]